MHWLCSRKEYISHFDIQPGNRAIMKISNLLPKNPIVSVDVGMHQCWCAQSDFQKISEAYGIKAATPGSYEEIDDYKDWFKDNDPCLIDIPLSEDSLLTPKIKFETSVINPGLDKEAFEHAQELLK